MVEGDRITGHLLDLADVEAVLRVLGEDAVIFLRLDEALRRSWATSEHRRPYQRAFEAICHEAMRAAAASAQCDDLEKDTAPALVEGKTPLRP